jgi:putative heme-binding domain-containing protein
LEASADAFVSAAAVRLVTADRVLAEALGKLMLASSSRQRNVVELLLSGKLDSRLLGGQRVFQLVRSAKPPEKQQLQELLKSLQNPDRQAIVERYAKHLAETPSPENGKKVFAKHCAGCHRVAGTGVNIGPEISDTRTKQPRELLTAILNPSLAVDNRYFQTSILTADGRTLQGLLESETLDSLVIRTTAGEQEIVRRADIELKRISPKSLMPDGFENSISPSDMSDLISFLKNWRYLDGSVPAVLPARKP